MTTIVEGNKRLTNLSEHVSAVSLHIPSTNGTRKYSVTTATPIQSDALAVTHIVLYASQDMWCVQGVNPVAVAPIAGGASGSMRLMGENQYRVPVLETNNKFSFLAISANGFVEMTPGA